jgi:ATP-dependent RNA helicase DHX29
LLIYIATSTRSQGKNLEARDGKGVGKGASSVQTPRSVTPNLGTPAESDNSDAMVSDLESDMEPDQLVPIYLKIKGRIFEHNPDLLQAKPPKAKGSKRRGLQPVPPPRESAAARKLLSQLKKIESDALFDRDEAEALWPAKRTELAREFAAKPKSQPLAADCIQEDTQNEDAKSGDMLEMNAKDDDSSAEEDLSDGSLLGDMFGAIPDDPPASRKNARASADDHDITLRDFGKQNGLTPRRILEEAVRARLVVT